MSITLTPHLVSMTLLELEHDQAAVVLAVTDMHVHDTVAQRLRDLGFVAGESVAIRAYGPIQADPVLVQIGETRFALRRSEAARVQVARL